MKVISIGMGQKTFEEDSLARERMIKYGNFFDEFHIVGPCGVGGKAGAGGTALPTPAPGIIAGG